MKVRIGKFAEYLAISQVIHAGAGGVGRVAIQLAQLTGLVEAGVLRTHVERTFDIADTPAALDHVDSGQAKGKVVVTMSPAPATSATAQTR